MSFWCPVLWLLVAAKKHMRAHMPRRAMSACQRVCCQWISQLRMALLENITEYYSQYFPYREKIFCVIKCTTYRSQNCCRQWTWGLLFQNKICSYRNTYPLLSQEASIIPIICKCSGISQMIYFAVFKNFASAGMLH